MRKKLWCVPVLGWPSSNAAPSLVLGCRAWVCMLLVVLCSFPRGAFGQATSGIQGEITDPSGAKVPRARVTVTNENTGTSRSSTSDDNGFYRVLDLLPGNYQIRIEMEGFKSLMKRGFSLQSDSIAGLNFNLELGEASQTIDVVAEEPQVETTLARVSQVLSGKEVESLPSAGRGVYYLVTTSPGVVGKSESDSYCCDAFSTFKGPVISSGAGNEYKSNYLLDGLSLRYSSGSYWGALFSPNIDAVSEIRVSTNPYLAEFGTISGPQVQLTTKSGTNEFHGTAHFSNVDGALNARPYFSERTPDRYTRYFGGTVGGPVIKNRLFFFGGYQGLREKTAQSSVYIVETQAFYDFVTQTYPNSVAASVLTMFPPLRYPTTSLPNNQYLGEVSVDTPVTRTGEQFNARVDYQSSSGNDRLFGNYWNTSPHQFNPAVREAFSGPVDTPVTSVNVVHTHSFSPRTLSELRFGFNRLYFDYTNGVPSTDSVPGISTDDGLYVSGGSSHKSINEVKTYQIEGTSSLVRGRHTVKLGGNYRRVLALDDNDFGIADLPIYAFSTVLDFANDRPYLEQRNLDVATGKIAHTIYNTILANLSFFAQDTWQIAPNLTLNYGLRWEDFFPLGFRSSSSPENWQPVFDLSQLTPAAIAQFRNVKVDRYYRNQLTNFSPRLSVGWDPTKNGKMSIRAGIALFYDEVPVGPLYGGGIYANPPGIASVTAGPQYGVPIVYGLAPEGTRDFPSNPALQAPQIDEFGGIVGSRVSLGGIARDFQIPRVWDMFVGQQYQVSKDLRLEVDYRYRRTTNDLLATDVNRFTGDLIDGVVDRINPHFDSIIANTNWGRRVYHGLIVSASKRFSQGWLASASYNYNHNTSNLNGSDSLNTGQNITDWMNRDLEFARDDIPHVFSLHSVWDLPILRGRSGWVAGAFGGWQINSIWSFQSGGILTPVSTAPYGQGGDFNGDGQRNDRPDLPVGSVPRSFSKQQWLDGALLPSAFPLPDPSALRTGTLPRDFFRGPGYARIDLALGKEFPIHERFRVQVRGDFFNLLNRVNISRVSSRINSANFGAATGAYQNRTIQLGVKLQF